MVGYGGYDQEGVRCDSHMSGVLPWTVVVWFTEAGSTAENRELREGLGSSFFF